MADPYWRNGDSRQQQQQQPTLSPVLAKRPRSDYDVSGGHELGGYFARESERTAYPVVRDTESLGASYDRYLQNAQLVSYGGGDSARAITGGLSGHSVDGTRMIGVGGSDPAVAVKSHTMGLEGGRPERPLPLGATNTLFVEGLPANCTRREVSHIFRPFVGYEEVRLVSKESRRPDGDPLVLCFVDFVSPAHAATAMDALQGYRFDEHDRGSANLRLQFSRHPGARSGGGHRGKR